MNDVIFVPTTENREQYIAHENEQVRINEQFQKDLEEQFGVSDIYAIKLFTVALSRGHSQGYTGVLEEYEELVNQKIAEDELDEYL